MKRVGLGVVALAIVALAIIFGVKKLEAWSEARADAMADSLVARADRNAAGARDSTRATKAVLDSIIADTLRRAQRDRETQFMINSVRNEIALLSEDISGVIRLMPRPGTSDTAELVGPRTRSALRKADSTITKLEADKREDAKTIAKLIENGEKQQRAFATLDSAFTDLKKASDIYKSQRYSWWRDGIAITVGYGALQCPDDSAKTVCTGGNLSLSYTLVRPLRALPRVRDILFTRPVSSGPDYDVRRDTEHGIEIPIERP